MCYHDNVDALYFDNFHVACLSGDNGHGKSALLDAITWALWGKTRAKSDDDLIHMGESEMEVEFEFLVDNAKYRVIRKRSKGSLRRPKQPILELQIATSEGYIPITGNNIRETEKKIIELLRMDYDTFINSALLLQGRADEFSMKRPGERKEVIANILNLAIYDELEKTARNVVKDKEVRYREINDTIARIEKQLEQKAYFENELIAADESMKLLSAELEKQETSIKRLRGVEEALKFKAEQSIDLGRQIEKTKQQLYFFEKTISGQKDRIQKYEAILAEYGNKILENQKKLNEIVDLEKDLTAKRKTIEELSNRTHHLNSANTRLKDEMKELKSKLDMLDQDKVECPLCGTELGKEGKERILSNYRNQGNEKGDAYRINQKEIQEKRQELENLRREVGKFESSLISERTQIERRIATLDKDRSEAEFNLPKEKESVVQAQAAIESLHKSMTDDSSKCDTLTIEVKDLQKIKNELGSIERVYKELREKERISQGRIAELKANLNRCVQLAIEKSENSKVLHLLI